MAAHSITCLLLGLALALTAGCASTAAGRPARSTRPQEILAQLKDAPEAKLVDQIKAYHKADDPAERKRIRDQIIDFGMVAIDQEYAIFVEQFTASKKTFDTATDLGAIFASSAASAFTPATTKNVLSLTSGGFTATRTSVDKNYFYEQSIKAIVQQMTAERRAVASDLIKGLASSTDQYPLAAALQDLERYYFAGTIDGAFAGIQKDAAQKEAQADETIRQELKRTVDYRTLAETWITNNGAAAARAKITTWIGQQTDALKLVKIRAAVVAAAFNSTLTPEQIVTALPKEDADAAIAAINADRGRKPRGTTFEGQFSGKADLDKLIALLPEPALASLAAGFAGDDILELTKALPAAPK